MGTKCKLSKHINLIKELISNEIGLWLFMMAIIVIFPIIKIYDLHLFDNCEMNGFVDNITYSIIAAFIFYLFTVFYPKYKAYLKMYQNIYQNFIRIDDIIKPTIQLFVDDDKFEEFPQKFVEKFVKKNEKGNDKYALDPSIAGNLIEMLPILSNMIISLRSRYSDYLHPEELSYFDVLEDAGIVMMTDKIKKEMSYQEIEILSLQLECIYNATRSLLDKYKQYT